MNKRRSQHQRQINKQGRRRMQFNALSFKDKENEQEVQNEVNEHPEVDQENDLDDKDKS